MAISNPKAPPRIEVLLSLLSDTPGVYLMKDAEGRVLYVGKAKSLKKRVRSYFQKGASHAPKTRVMLRKVSTVETIVTTSEVEALVLENNLIKRHRPPYNIMLRDDKNYPYIRLSVQEPFPRLSVVRRAKRDGAKYYGPYVGAGAMRETLRVIHRHFPLADCEIVIDGSLDRPCLQYQMGRCKAPCTGLQSQEDYLRTVDEVRLFLEGRDDELVALLTRRMTDAAAHLEFERAARIRDQIEQIRQTLTRQRVAIPGGGEADVLGIASDGGWTGLQVLFIRGGSLVGRKAFFWETPDGIPEVEIYESFITQFYAGDVTIPERILVPVAIPGAEALSEWLATQRGKACRLEMPSRGRGLALLHLAADNAHESLMARLGAERAGAEGLAAVMRTLRLPRLPLRIEGFDISHIQGDLTVASMVVWQGNGPRKADYRHFRIRSTTGPDDFLAMREVVTRRYQRVAEESGTLPDLILIDGGRGQLGAAMAALKDLGISGAKAPEIIGLAKERDERFERVYKPGMKNPIMLKPGAPATRILQQIRDEAHRFAVTYHRKLRSLRLRESLLDEVPGIGPARKRLLLSTFGSVAGIKKASVAEVAALPNMNETLARTVLEHLR